MPRRPVPIGHARYSEFTRRNETDKRGASADFKSLTSMLNNIRDASTNLSNSIATMNTTLAYFGNIRAEIRDYANECRVIRDQINNTTEITRANQARLFVAQGEVNRRGDMYDSVISRLPTLEQSMVVLMNELGDTQARFGDQLGTMNDRLNRVVSDQHAVNSEINNYLSHQTAVNLDTSGLMPCDFMRIASGLPSLAEFEDDTETGARKQ